MEGEIAAELRVNDGEMLLLGGIGGVDSLHTHVEANNEIVEVQTDAQTIADSQLVPELRELKLSARLLFVFTQGPYITGIDEQGTTKLPEQIGTILEIEVELHIARLVDEVDTSVGANELTRTQTAHTPTTHTIGTTREETLLERQDTAVAIGIGNTKTKWNTSWLL